MLPAFRVLQNEAVRIVALISPRPLRTCPSRRSQQQPRSATPIPTPPLTITSSLPQWTADRAEYMTGATADAARRRLPACRVVQCPPPPPRQARRDDHLLLLRRRRPRRLTTFLEQQTELSAPSPPTLVAARSSSRPRYTPSSVSSTAWRPPRPSAPPRAIWQAMSHGRAGRVGDHEIGRVLITKSAEASGGARGLVGS
jgi:hypothetical protein